MEKIYLILAHKSSEQIEKQINALQEEKVTFYIHIDLKSDLNEFKNLERIPNVILIKERVDCIWGDFSIVIATLNLIKNVIKNHNDGFCILMSGNDYPIKSKKVINSFLNENKDKIFINLRNAETVWPNFNERIDKYRINLSSNRDHFLLLKQGLSKKNLKHFIKGRIALKDFIFVLFKKRKININMKFYGGSQWWAMNINDLIKIYDFIQSNKSELFPFFKYSHVPDEFFFHTIIMYVIQNDNADKIQDSLTYVNWSRKNCKLPVTFGINDISELRNQPTIKLYARKFDINFDKEIFEEIDKNIS